VFGEFTVHLGPFELFSLHFGKQLCLESAVIPVPPQRVDEKYDDACEDDHSYPKVHLSQRIYLPNDFDRGAFKKWAKDKVLVLIKKMSSA
jgi:hypothetical protein